MAYTILFLLKNVNSFCICKSYSHFFSKNNCELDILLTRTVNILTTNELVKLMMLWKLGPVFFINMQVQGQYPDEWASFQVACCKPILQVCLSWGSIAESFHSLRSLSVSCFHVILQYIIEVAKALSYNKNFILPWLSSPAPVLYTYIKSRYC